MAARGRTAFRVARRIAAAACAVGVAVVAGPIQAAGAADTTTLLPTTEAWYQPDPTCAAATADCGANSPLAGLPPAPPVSPYPPGTLHVGSSLGRETARTYLGFALPDADQTGAASLDIPLDTSAADGSSQPERAKIQVCAVSGQIAEVDGAMGAPPAVDCAHAVPLTYAATPAPHFQADVSSLLSGASSTSGLALLPAPAGGEATDAWRVVFSAHDRTDAGTTKPASLAVTVADTTVEGAPDDTSAVGPTALGDLALPALTGAGLPAVPNQPTPNAAPTAERGNVARAARAPSPVAQVVDRYAYAAVWLLPLLLLVGFHQAATLLTRDLRPRGSRC